MLPPTSAIIQRTIAERSKTLGTPVVGSIQWSWALELASLVLHLRWGRSELTDMKRSDLVASCAGEVKRKRGMVVVTGRSEVVDISGLWGAVTGIGEREIDIPVGGAEGMAVGEWEIGILSRVVDCRRKLKMCGTRRGRNIGRFASICASTTYKSDFEGWLVDFEMINQPGVR